MKKGINIFAILGIVLGIAVIGTVLFFVLRRTPADSGGAGGAIEEIDSISEAYRLESFEQLCDFAESGGYEYYYAEDNSGASLYRVSLLDKEAVATYFFDQEGKTTHFEAFYFINGDVCNEADPSRVTITTEQLATDARLAVEQFCAMFGCDFVPDMYLRHYDGGFTLVEEDNSCFQKVVDDEAELHFSIRDREGYYWEMRVSMSYGTAMVNVRKYFSVEQCIDYVANISLYELNEEE